MTGEEILSRFLGLYWLRPENAVISAVLARQLQQLPGQGRTLDLSCGDGLFMYTVFGGEFSFGFDIFTGTGNLEKVRSSNVDIYDYMSEQYSPEVVLSPDAKLTFGVDFKESMLSKARTLDFYDNLISSDVCKEIALESGSIDTIYLNHTINAYDNLMSALSEIRRIMSSTSRAYISVYDVSIANFLKDIYTGYPEEVAKIIDRGLLSTVFRHQYTLEKWTTTFEMAQFKIEKIYPLVSREFVPYWCIGLRPIAPLLIKMTNLMRENNREALMDIKSQWVSLFMDLARAFIDSGQDVDQSSTYLFELSK